jgi:hypothetical protein
MARAPNTVDVLLGNGDGTFAAAPGSPIALGDGTGLRTVADFTGEGAADLVTLSGDGSSNTGTLATLLGNGDGTFTPAAGPPLALSPAPGWIATADINGNGKLDAAVTADDKVLVLLGRGDGTFAPPTGAPLAVPGWFFTGIAIGDVDGDGRLDIAVAGRKADQPQPSGLYVFLGSGGGRFHKAAGSPFAVPTPAGTISTNGPALLGATTVRGHTALIVNPGLYGLGLAELYVLVSAGPAPDTRITRTTLRTKARQAVLAFRATRRASRFECRLRRGRHRARFRACTSPARYRHLVPGRYRFEVRAVGPGGHDTSPARRTFRIS